MLALKEILTECQIGRDAKSEMGESSEEHGKFFILKFILIL
jgi:hypothetical protein